MDIIDQMFLLYFFKAFRINIAFRNDPLGDPNFLARSSLSIRHRYRFSAKLSYKLFLLN